MKLLLFQYAMLFIVMVIVWASVFDATVNNGAVAKTQSCVDDYNAGRDMTDCYERMEGTR